MHAANPGTLTTTRLAIGAQPGDLPSVVKVTWRPSWNQAMFSPTDLANALVGLSLTPGLGLHRREKPAPIYWADGIDGVTPDDLRFVGNGAVRLD